MHHTSRAFRSAPRRGPLHLFEPSSPEAHVTRWRINGHRATVLIWTREEWERMTERPPDAQYVPCGVWCALRVD